MNNLRNILIICGFIIHLAGFSQSDTILKESFVNIATLIVDFDSYEFEGGDMSYYSCASCPIDSIPFTIDYDSPGDFGGVTFKLSSQQDTVFHATIIWMGTGQIYYPDEFNLQAPFINSNTVINRPDDLRYIYTDGNVITDPGLLNKADSAWSSIESLEITKLFAEQEYKSAIYLYPPTVGMFDATEAKWVIFLYNNGKSNTITNNYIEKTQVQIFPNPTNRGGKINLNLTNTNITTYRICNSLGQLLDWGEVLSNGQQLDMTFVNSGLYFLLLTDENNKMIATEKIIVE